MTTTALVTDMAPTETRSEEFTAAPPPTLWRQVRSNQRIMLGGGLLLFMVVACFATLPWTLSTGKNGSALYTYPYDDMAYASPKLFVAGSHKLFVAGWFGFDKLGRSVLVRSLVGGTISLAIGLAAAAISVVLGVSIGMIAGFQGGMVDSVLMRIVDILYGLPYILLVILFKIGFEEPLAAGLTYFAVCWVALIILAAVGVVIGFSVAGPSRWITWLAVAFLVLLGIGMIEHGHPHLHGIALKPSAQTANMVVLFLAIGLVSWLSMARVIRGQVLSLRSQPFIEACRAMGLKQHRIFTRHILPNLIGPITVYATMIVPSAILQESFLSFLGIGVNDPLATWGSLASEGVASLSPLKFYWWQLIFPCALLALTLLSLNFLGDGLRDVFDPKKEAAKI
jgi:oligopeptide transport system permease protein